MKGNFANRGFWEQEVLKHTAEVFRVGQIVWVVLNLEAWESGQQGTDIPEA